MPVNSITAAKAKLSFLFIHFTSGSCSAGKARPGLGALPVLPKAAAAPGQRAPAQSANCRLVQPRAEYYTLYIIYTAVQLRYAARKRGQKTAKAARASLPAPTARNNHKNSRFVTDPAQSGLLIFGYFTQLFRAFCKNTLLLNIFYHIFATFKV